ncbi:MAG TPA: M28 family peptidase [Gemmatimonadaceae bacterium]|nr:M28 family peptidase [Gemmatimonadaceae bacterium]
MTRWKIAAALVFAGTPALWAQAGPPAGTRGPMPPALSAITEADLRRDMFALGGDAMRGREAGTLDEMRASMWIADRAREAGLQPAGDDGSYFQWWSMRRTRVSDASRVAIGDRPLALWKDVIVLSPMTVVMDQPIVWVGAAAGAELAAMDLDGKVVAAELIAPAAAANVTPQNQSPFSNAAIRQRTDTLVAKGVTAIVFVSGGAPEFDEGFRRTVQQRIRGTYGIDSLRPAGAPVPLPGAGRGNVQRQVPSLWISREMTPLVRDPGARLALTLAVASFTYPSVNIVAKVPGTDRARRDEMVLFSGHQDHDGVRYDVAGDSTWNGADDNASVAVAMLAIGRAVAKRPMPRTALFVWHGAEERGLLGSRWFSGHPTVEKSKIVAVLNADMIGRNHPDSAALLGVQPPHLNSRALAAAAYQANAMTGRFVVDTSWDNPRHREGWYFRSDHLPYARAGIPAIMFSTLLHADYHTPRDNPENIDITKMTRMTKWMYATGWIIGTAKDRPDVVPGFRLER